MKKKKKIVAAVSAIAILLVSGLVYMGLYGFPVSNGLEEAVTLSVQGNPMVGKETATVTIVEFADYKCVWCKKWNDEIYPELEKDYIDTGKVNFVFKNLAFLGDDSKTAAYIGEAIYKQNPDVFWDYHKLLFKNQGKEDEVWATESFLFPLIEKNLKEIDMDLLKEDMVSEEVKKEIMNEKNEADNAHVQGTPSVFINGQLVRNSFDYEFLKEAIDAELAKQVIANEK